MIFRLPARWGAFGVVTLATALNYLDRQLLAAVAPEVRYEFGLTSAEYGLLISAFSLAYALSSPAAGLFIDRVGLKAGISILVALWSMAAMATGFVGSFAALLVARAWLGLAESGGIPASGKANALYLPPKERALGAALNQIGLSLGAAAAPLLAAWLAADYDWRAVFLVAGALGFLWIPLWLATARAVPPKSETPQSSLPLGELAGDTRLWGLAAANVLAMVLFSLWSNWTTLLLVSEYGLSQAEANRRFAWIPPIAANLGGLAGGWAAHRLIRGAQTQPARLRVCLGSALVLLATAAVPLSPSAEWATFLIALSFFFTVSMSVNIYAMPLDLFGAARAGFAVSVLTFAFGLMQAVLSPTIGALIDRYGFGPVSVAGSVAPLAAYAILRRTTASLRIRRARPADLEAIARIQRTSPQAAQWAPQAYLAYDCRVAVSGRGVVGFIVLRRSADAEYEILNLAVEAGARRRGIATALIRSVLRGRSGVFFLEVRESNQAAQALYRRLGFQEAGRRPGYYTDPYEGAIVMRFQSC